MDKIFFQDWDYTKGDPFSGEYGTRIFVNDKLVSEYSEVNKGLLMNVLKALNIEFEIVNLEYDCHEQT
ncbi:hypothetical protein SAMN04487895_101629 [Paenibacillus sophorae]|uniref:Uncharacterized protein n=1 Tax=Paenibacillus sophorae TaxID=1333845 RepID=A0A1H8GT03_9BACL|nr:hypothetical protein [Paenibacillus sophorae]QWU14327.1 hypothetical protein KP014_20690 [Paenibacillus sophorae]SEN46940.1 hypothetical protein SAMN04487895_101629 [Paenibacillus sophorae]